MTVRDNSNSPLDLAKTSKRNVRASKTFILVLLVMLLASGAANAQLNGLYPEGDAGFKAVPASPDAKQDSSSTSVSFLPTIASMPAASSDMHAGATWPALSDAPAGPTPPTASNQGFHLSISPYLWFAGMHGAVGAQGYEASVHASFSDIFSYLNFGLMFAVDPSYNRIVMPLDFMWLKLSDDKATPELENVTSVKTKSTQDILTQKVGYRVIDSGQLKVDGLVGFRYMHLGNTLTPQPQITNSYYSSADWVDAVAGSKMQAALSPKLVLTILGDAGGGGADSDYQVAGLLGWKLKRMIMQGGWRYLSVNYRPSGDFIYDTRTSGLILGVTIPLK